MENALKYLKYSLKYIYIIVNKLAANVMSPGSLCHAYIICDMTKTYALVIEMVRMSKFTYPRMWIRMRIQAREASRMQIHMRMTIQKNADTDIYANTSSKISADVDANIRNIFKSHQLLTNGHNEELETIDSSTHTHSLTQSQRV